MAKRSRNRTIVPQSAPKIIASGAKVDVVITTGGRWDFLEKCLDAVKRQTVKVNIILFDNGTDEKEKEEHIHLFEKVSTKRSKIRLGFPAANNEASRMGNAPYILFLNDDCILFEDAIENMLKSMNEPDVAVCGAKLMFPIDSTSPIRPAGKVQHVGISMDIRGNVGHPLVGWSADHPKTCVTRDAWAITGACFMISRIIFTRLNGFDTIFGEGTFEDVDLCLRVRQMGYRVLVNADAKGYHYAGATSEQKNVGFPLQQNSMIFRQRWQGTPFLAWDEWSYF